MKIEDLMVGDWVYIAEHPMRKEAKQVKPEHFLRSLVIFEPIPITPKILEKNGFIDKSFEANLKYKYFIHTNEYQLGYYTKTNSFNVYKRGIDPFYTKDVFCCGFQNIVKYVHELQHALKLCGIDKEMVV